MKNAALLTAIFYDGFDPFFFFNSRAGNYTIAERLTNILMCVVFIRGVKQPG